MKKKFKSFKVFTKKSKALQDFNNLDYYEYSFSDPSKYNTEYNKPKIWTKNSKNSEFAVL